VLKREDFERGLVPMGSLSRGDGRNQQRIIELLKESPLTAYSQGEIQRGLDIKFPSAVNSALHSLQSKGCVECRVIDSIQYWRFLHDVPDHKTTEVSNPIKGVDSSKGVSEEESNDKKGRVDKPPGERVKVQKVGSKPHNKSGGVRKANIKSLEGG